MLDGLMGKLKQEQADDDEKVAYCAAEFDKHEDIKKGLVLDISDLSKAVDDAQGTMETLAKEIAALSAGIKDLDKSVAEATATRKNRECRLHQDSRRKHCSQRLVGL